MKRIIVFLFLTFLLSNVFSQKSVNADGTLKLKGNVAIIVNGCHFSFMNGKAIKSVNDETIAQFNTSMRALCIQKFLDYGFGVVNRDDKAYRQVMKLIEENKLEDYLDGISVTAKNQGADYLFCIDISSYSENNKTIQYDFSTRLINVENNLGYHSYYRSEVINMEGGEQKIRNVVSNMIDCLDECLDDLLLDILPEQYYVAKSNGKALYLGAYQPNGKILQTDKFYAFKFNKENWTIAQKTAPIQVLELVAVCGNPTGSDGYCKVESNTKLQDYSGIVLLRNQPEMLFQGTNQMRMTFFGLNFDLNSYDGLIKNRINNAVNSAITRHPGLQLIEHDHLADLKKERELQKSEDFINGHVVKQMKAIGAEYLLKLEQYNRKGTSVSFKLSLISIEQNKIIRTVDVNSSIDNIENEMYKQICERAVFPCTVNYFNSGKGLIELTSMLSLRNGDNCILSLTKAVTNPTNSEVSYSTVDLCSLKFKEYRGNKCIMSINKVLSPENMADIEKNSLNGFVTFRLDGSGIKSVISSVSEVKKTADNIEKKEKRRQFMGAMLDALKNSTDASVKVNGTEIYK